MREWKSKINGKHLRELINDGESFEILKQLESMVGRITSKPETFKIDEYDITDFEELYYNIESDVSMGEDGLKEYVESEDWISSISELVDDRLTQFYDLCDNSRIWITV